MIIVLMCDHLAYCRVKGSYIPVAAMLLTTKSW